MAEHDETTAQAAEERASRASTRAAVVDDDAPRETTDERRARLAREKHARDAAKRARDAELDGDALLEVMVDTYGSDPEHQYARGDLVSGGDLLGAGYDPEWALRQGSLRLAREYQGSGLANTVQPVETQAGSEAAEPSPWLREQRRQASGKR